MFLGIQDPSFFQVCLKLELAWQRWVTVVTAWFKFLLILELRWDILIILGKAKLYISESARNNWKKFAWKGLSGFEDYWKVSDHFCKLIWEKRRQSSWSSRKCRFSIEFEFSSAQSASDNEIKVTFCKVKFVQQ